MTKQTSNKLGIILALIAAVLAFSAALIAYVHRGEVEATPIGGGLFMLALAYYIYRSRKPDSVE
jgi:uncharacterized membrane protein